MFRSLREWNERRAESRIIPLPMFLLIWAGVLLPLALLFVGLTFWPDGPSSHPCPARPHPAARILS